MTSAVDPTSILINSDQNGVTSERAPDLIMDNCPVDLSTEEDSLCGISLSSCMKPSPGNLCS
jgi:hypothetical protein